MHSTYLNDLQDVAYPLLGDAARPFPDSVLTGLGICYAEEEDSSFDINKLYISQITISATFVDVILVYENSLVGTFTVNYETSSTASLDAVDTRYSGYICVGIVPATCYGTYIDTFRLDPSCVRRDVIRDVYSTVVVNGETPVDVGDAFAIKPYGDLYIEKTMSGSETALTLKCTSDRTLSTQLFSGVVTVNGANNGEQLHTLKLVVNDAETERELSVPVVRTDSKTITVVLEGTSAFPHCFGDSDQAGEWTEERGVL